MDTEIEVQGDGPDETTVAVVPPDTGLQPEPGHDGQPETRADKRIGKITAERHAADRRAEAAHQRAEAAEARAADAERRLRAATEAGRGVMTQNVEAAIKQAETDLRVALADGDVDGQTKAYRALARAEAKAETLQSIPQQQPREEPRQPQRQQNVSPSTAAWMAENPWFSEDATKKAQALRVHAQIVAEGYQAESPAYFKALTERTRELAIEEDEDEAPPPKRTPAGSGVTRTVAPAARALNKIRLSEAELRLARDMGVTKEVWAQNKAAAIAAGKISA